MSSLFITKIKPIVYGLSDIFFIIYTVKLVLAKLEKDTYIHNYV